MHLPTCLQVLLLLVSFSTALAPPPSTIASSSSSLSAPTSIMDKSNLNPRLSWDDIVNGAKSLYSQAMATPTSTSSTSPTAASHGDLKEGEEHNNNTQFKKGKGWTNGSNFLERRGLLAGAGLALVALGLFG